MVQHVVVDPGFGSFLKGLREERGWSLRTLGERVHCSHGHLWDLEHGRKRPSVAVAALLDTALDADGQLASMGHDPADAERLIAPTWGMRQPDTMATAVSTFAAATYGMWHRLAVQHPSPHREGPVQAVRRWNQHRLN